ncbi:MAG: hypothetical protein A2Y66_01890 [Nitrospirae bacterium RBG_13_41_22]|nr:MAG: hypothetical protein A2Y66_01890 [Nitrospirae bacterium RBG_13_41_22]
MERTKMEEKVYDVVAEVVNSFENPSNTDRSEIVRIAARKLDKIGVNVARDDTKASDYLCEALDFYLY